MFQRAEGVVPLGDEDPTCVGTVGYRGRRKCCVPEKSWRHAEAQRFDSKFEMHFRDRRMKVLAHTMLLLERLVPASVKPSRLPPPHSFLTSWSICTYPTYSPRVPLVTSRLKLKEKDTPVYHCLLGLYISFKQPRPKS